MKKQRIMLDFLFEDCNDEMLRDQLNSYINILELSRMPQREVPDGIARFRINPSTRIGNINIKYIPRKATVNLIQNLDFIFNVIKRIEALDMAYNFIGEENAYLIVSIFDKEKIENIAKEEAEKLKLLEE